MTETTPTNSSTSASASERGARRSEIGMVVAAKMQKTVTVKVERSFAHTQIGKVQRRTVKFLVHDEKSSCGVGDVVEIRETRPLSARKRWELVRILTKAK